MERIREFAPDVLCLDFYMPPHNGLAVLRQVNEAVQKGEPAHRPALALCPRRGRQHARIVRSTEGGVRGRRDESSAKRGRSQSRKLVPTPFSIASAAELAGLLHVVRGSSAAEPFPAPSLNPGDLVRPKFIVGMSSVASCNEMVRSAMRVAGMGQSREDSVNNSVTYRGCLDPVLSPAPPRPPA